MNVLRLLMLAVVVWAVWRLIKLSSGALARRQQQPPAAQAGQPGYEVMTRCAKCGTHLPVSSLSRAGLCGRCSD
ncbi:MAG: hypothetical protein ACREVL_02445 [Solimonas sp.]